jgi:hypothetical protein
MQSAMGVSFIFPFRAVCIENTLDPTQSTQIPVAFEFGPMVLVSKFVMWGSPVAQAMTHVT